MRVGSRNRRSKKTIFTTEEVITYPGYVDIDKDDICLIRVNGWIDFGATVNKIELPIVDDVRHNNEVTVLGWGYYMVN